MGSRTPVSHPRHPSVGVVLMPPALGVGGVEYTQGPIALQVTGPNGPPIPDRQPRR
jgi:hypothetical protein